MFMHNENRNQVLKQHIVKRHEIASVFFIDFSDN